MKMVTLTLLLLASILTIAEATHIPSSHVLHERRSVSNQAWIKGESLAPNTTLPIRIALTQRNLEKGAHLLLDISDPDSPKYGQHLSIKEVHDLFAPSEASTNAVYGWLASSGIHTNRISHSIDLQWLQFNASVEEMERLFKAKYHMYEHALSQEKRIACDEYYVPQKLQEHVDFIIPGIKLSSYKMHGDTKDSYRNELSGIADKSIDRDKRLRDEPLICDTITPDCISTLYGIPPGTKAVPGNGMGVLQLEDVKYSQEDLDLFYQRFAPRIKGGTGPVAELVDGGVASAPSNSTGQDGTLDPEANLDYQMAIPIIYPQKTFAIAVSDHDDLVDDFDVLLRALDASYCDFPAHGEAEDDAFEADIHPGFSQGAEKSSEQCGVYGLTNVISISYGQEEKESTVQYQRRICNEFMKFGLMGVSVLAASGDEGVTASHVGVCIGRTRDKFSPDFPCNCPWVTSVGATELKSDGPFNITLESATSLFGSGGGFSNLFPTPKYQAKAVGEYFVAADSSVQSYEYYNTSGMVSNDEDFDGLEGLYNRGGRGYPDVSAFGQAIQMVYEGTEYVGGGSSASAPIFGAILTRINEERIAVGKRPVGFVNPSLYKHPEILSDVINGSNGACRTSGFHAQKGWDPVTGLGTPNYPRMLDFFMGLP